MMTSPCARRALLTIESVFFSKMTRALRDGTANFEMAQEKKKE
jgi:hypothetical protein